MEGVAVDDVGGYDGVAHLDAGGDCGGGTELLAGCSFVVDGGLGGWGDGGIRDGGVRTQEEGDLADYPVVAFVDADSPDDEADCRAVSDLPITRGYLGLLELSSAAGYASHKRISGTRMPSFFLASLRTM